MTGGMDMGQLNDAYRRAQQAGGVQFADIDRLVISNGLIVRLIGSMGSSWEHFVDTAKGPRPVYCTGPESDCPVCAIVSIWAHSDDINLQKKSADVRAKERFYFNVLDRSPQGRAWHAEKKKTYLLVQNAKGLNVGSMFLQSVGQVCQMRAQQGQPDDPNSFDLALSKQGDGLKTKYGAQFTGDTTPLTDEEIAYEQNDLSELSKVTPVAEVAAIMEYFNSSPGAQQAAQQEATSFDTAKLQQQMGQITPAAAPAVAAPATAPVAAPAAAPAAPATAPAPAPQVEYADTTPQEGYDPKAFYQVPCGQCGKTMQISMLPTGKQLKCHGCGKIYAHPGD